jgi:pimeloyl-ACP methyl ester carboxylesterase
MSTVISADGTTIAYEHTGNGPAVVLVDGAMCHRGGGPMRPLAALLSDHFTVYAYDRRGRGESGDTPPYAVAREIEDLHAVLDAAGGAAAVYAISSGVALALAAAVAGAPITRLAGYEPPYVTETVGGATKKEYTERLRELLAAGRDGDAVALFITFVGTPAAVVDGMRGQPFWPAMAAIAPTLAYDNEVLGDGSVPRDVIGKLTLPVLIADGGASPDFLRGAAQATADAIPGARYATLDGQTHDVAPEALAPLLVDFFTDRLVTDR